MALYADNGAYGTYGDAFFMISGGHFYGNGLSGIYFDDMIAYARGTDAGGSYFGDGDATALIFNVDSMYNSEYGLYVGQAGAYSQWGDAFVSITNSDFSYSGQSGIYFDSYIAYAEYGDATAIIDPTFSSYNGGYGLYVGNWGAYAQYGNATMWIDGFTAYSNDEDGMYFADGMAQARGGDATAVLRDVYSAYNTGSGFYTDGYGAYAISGTAMAAVQGSDFYGNTESGMYISDSLAQSYGYGGENAHTVITQTRFSHNGEYGLFLGEFGAYAAMSGSATFFMDKAAFYSNGDTGFFTEEAWAHNAEHGGDVMASLISVTASYNGAGSSDGEGIYTQYGVYGYGGYAVVLMSGITTRYNYDSGIYFDDHVAKSYIGDAFVSISHVVTTYNGRTGRRGIRYVHRRLRRIRIVCSEQRIV